MADPKMDQPNFENELSSENQNLVSLYNTIKTSLGSALDEILDKIDLNKTSLKVVLVLILNLLIFSQLNQVRAQGDPHDYQKILDLISSGQIKTVEDLKDYGLNVLPGLRDDEIIPWVRTLLECNGVDDVKGDNAAFEGFIYYNVNNPGSIQEVAPIDGVCGSSDQSATLDTFPNDGTSTTLIQASNLEKNVSQTFPEVVTNPMSVHQVPPEPIYKMSDGSPIAGYTQADKRFPIRSEGDVQEEMEIRVSNGISESPIGSLVRDAVSVGFYQDPAGKFTIEVFNRVEPDKDLGQAVLNADAAPSIDLARSLGLLNSSCSYPFGSPNPTQPGISVLYPDGTTKCTLIEDTQKFQYSSFLVVNYNAPASESGANTQENGTTLQDIVPYILAAIAWVGGITAIYISNKKKKEKIKKREVITTPPNLPPYFVEVEEIDRIISNPVQIASIENLSEFYNKLLTFRSKIEELSASEIESLGTSKAFGRLLIRLKTVDNTYRDIVRGYFLGRKLQIDHLQLEKEVDQFKLQNLNFSNDVNLWEEVLSIPKQQEVIEVDKRINLSINGVESHKTLGEAAESLIALVSSREDQHFKRRVKSIKEDFTNIIESAVLTYGNYESIYASISTLRHIGIIDQVDGIKSRENSRVLLGYNIMEKGSSIGTLVFDVNFQTEDNLVQVTWHPETLKFRDPNAKKNVVKEDISDSESEEKNKYELFLESDSLEEKRDKVVSYIYENFLNPDLRYTKEQREEMMRLLQTEVWPNSELVTAIKLQLQELLKEGFIRIYIDESVVDAQNYLNLIADSIFDYASGYGIPGKGRFTAFTAAARNYILRTINKDQKFYELLKNSSKAWIVRDLYRIHFAQILDKTTSLRELHIVLDRDNHG